MKATIENEVLEVVKDSWYLPLCMYSHEVQRMIRQIIVIRRGSCHCVQALAATLF